MPIRVEHLMASSALPFIFPAVKINREYFGDGSMRQIAPISPALHLGADRVLVVGTSQPHAHSEPPRVRGNLDRKSTRLNSSHVRISYAVFCLKKKKKRR